MRHFLASTLVGALLITGGCDAPSPTAPAVPLRADVARASQLPADGNGNKTIVPLFEQRQVSCGTATLTRTFEGWFQFHFIETGNLKVVRVDILHQKFTFTNAAGETYVWDQRGSVLSWVEDGVVMVSLAGHGGTNIGLLRQVLATGETTFQAGQALELPRVAACAALT